MEVVLVALGGCAAGGPTSLIRLPEGYEVLTAHCEARAAPLPHTECRNAI